MPDRSPTKCRKEFPDAVKTLGDLLQMRRIERGLKLRNLATLLRVSSSTVSAWEHDRGMPSEEHLKTLTELLGLPATSVDTYPNS
jgi:transcriptional regulator with XRE-family HTH domain